MSTDQPNTAGTQSSDEETSYTPDGAVLLDPKKQNLHPDQPPQAAPSPSTGPTDHVGSDNAAYKAIQDIYATISTSPPSSLDSRHTSLPSWPPRFTTPELEHLVTHALTFSLMHGYALRPPQPRGPPNAASPAPLTLLPTPFPRRLYDLAVSISPIYNALYARIALDWAFLDDVMDGVAQVDPFQARLWEGWKSVRDEAKRSQVSR